MSDEHRASTRHPEEGDGRLRVLYLYNILLTRTDEEHTLSTRQLMDIMYKQYGIYMHRTTVPNDIALLREAGIEVMQERRQAWHYYISDRKFSVPELKLLIDAVQSSKFITKKKSADLVKKLISLTSETNADRLKRNLKITDRVRSENEKGFYIVDTINDAINAGRRISFVYTDFSGSKRQVARHGGKPYIVSPYFLVWDGDFYYLVGFNHNREKIANFRVDRIKAQPEILEEKAVPAPKGFNIGDYTRQVFRMFGSEETVDVTLLCENSVMKGVVDKFGMGVKTKKADSDHFEAYVTVSPSPTFFAWVFQWEGRVKIASPAEVREKYREMVGKA